MLINHCIIIIAVFGRGFFTWEAMNTADLKWWLWNGWSKKSSTSNAFYQPSTISYGKQYSQFITTITTHAFYHHQNSSFLIPKH